MSQSICSYCLCLLSHAEQRLGEVLCTACTRRWEKVSERVWRQRQRLTAAARSLSEPAVPIPANGVAHE